MWKLVASAPKPAVGCRLPDFCYPSCKQPALATEVPQLLGQARRYSDNSRRCPRHGDVLPITLVLSRIGTAARRRDHLFDLDRPTTRCDRRSISDWARKSRPSRCGARSKPESLGTRGSSVHYVISRGLLGFLFFVEAGQGCLSKHMALHCRSQARCCRRRRDVEHRIEGIERKHIMVLSARRAGASIAFCI